MTPNRTTPAPSTTSRPDRHLAFAAVLLAAAVLLTAVPWMLDGGPTASASTGSGATSLVSSSCSSFGHTGRAARSTPLTSPGFSLSTGDVMSVSYEFEIYNTTMSSIHVRVYAPSLFGQFTETNGTKLQFYLSPRTFDLTSFAWTSASAATATKTFASPVSINSNVQGVMTSELLGVMATAAQGTATLGFRWMWTVTFASNGSTVTSPWSVVSTAGPNPSIFYPAPYVQLQSKTNTTVAIGDFFTASLLGAISKTAFTSELEYGSNGNVIRVNHTMTTAGNSTPYPVGVRILPSKNIAEGPAKMLDHIRNNCGALLYSISITAIYAAHATVTFGVSPVTCGALSFNGSSFVSGSQTTVTPSGSSLSISAPSCVGHTFSTWTRTDGVSVTSLTSKTTTAIVSASGTLTATYV